ncbi:MAG: ribonucleotide-diphosphate reductase subunit alpha, partial [Patescibacteria group bacterium]
FSGTSLMLNFSNWPRLKRVTRSAVRFMDNVVDLFDFPVQAVTDLARKNRRIGLGIMGFADMLYELGVGYHTEEGRRLGEKVMATITETAHEMSEELAKEKGEFPNWPLSVFAKKNIKMRNAALTTVAPTGSISMFTDCSSGIEPNFALAYVKQDKDGHQYPYLNRYFEKALGVSGLSNDKVQEIKEEILKTGSIQGLNGLPESLKSTFVVAMDISAEDHTKMQSAFQKRVDNSISKTINFPNSATKEEVKEGFILAWKLKCKACTVYRDGSRTVQVLNLGTGENIISPTELGKGPAEKTAAIPISEAPIDIITDKDKIEPRMRPEVMAGKTYKVKTGYGNLYVTINNDENGAPFEVFATIGKSGGFFQEQSEAICRMISLSLRSGIKAEEVISNLKGIRGPMPMMTNKGTILSLPDAIGQILEEHVKMNGNIGTRLLGPEKVEQMVSVQAEKENIAPVYQIKAIADFGMMPGCPDCGAALQMQEGCMSCKSCGFSRCM